MKLYVWSRVKTLEGYNPGRASALAESKEEAIELIVNEYSGTVYSKRFFDEALALRAELENTEPTVYDSPQGFYQYGSM